jgi:hypothetical protein
VTAKSCYVIYGLTPVMTSRQIVWIVPLGYSGSAGWDGESVNAALVEIEAGCSQVGAVWVMFV